MAGSDALIGSGDYTYQLVADWAKLPEGWVFDDVAAVATDAQDRVYVFNRGRHPMMVFDRDGNLLNSWGENLFHRAHGLHIAPDQTLYCTDDGDHTVRKCTLDGKVLLEIGIPGRPSAFMSGEPFNRCTHTALSPDLDIYVSDGYANARVHKFDPTASTCFRGANAAPIPASSTFRTISSATPKAGSTSPTAKTTGYRFSTAMAGLRRNGTICTGPAASTWKAASMAAAMSASWGRGWRSTAKFPNLGPRLSILSRDGKLVSRVDRASGLPPAQFTAPHGLCVDSHGDVYVGEVS